MKREASLQGGVLPIICQHMHVWKLCISNMSYGATVGASAANRNLIEFKK